MSFLTAVTWVTLVVALNIDYAQSAGFLKSPQTQYALIGENVTFECHTRLAEDTHWVINNDHLSISYPEKLLEYENMGVIFDEVHNQEYFNLTMTIPATVDFNNTVIRCTLLDAGFMSHFSDNVYLIVFETLRPYRPSILIVEVVYTKEPTIHITINEPPRWPGYEISEIKMNITTLGDSSSYQISVANISGNYTVDIYEPVGTTVVTCVSIVVSASAVSTLYGESDNSIYNQNTSVYKAPGMFPTNALNLTVTYFYDVPFPLLRVQLPDVCPNQPINYTFLIENSDSDLPHGVIRDGPYNHEGPGLITHCIDRVEKNKNYSITVQVDSIAGSSNSQKYYFGTYGSVKDTEDKNNENGMNATENIKDVCDYNDVIAMGILSGLLSLMLVITCIVLLLFCVHYRYTLNQSSLNRQTVSSKNEYSMEPYLEPTYVNTVEPVPQPVYVNTGEFD